MKKQLVNLLCLVLGALLGVGGCLLVFFLRDGTLNRRDASREHPAVAAESLRNEELAVLAAEVTDCIARRDYEALSACVHPVYGLVLSPYSTINLGTNQCFSPQRVAAAGRDKTVYMWGVKYGSDEPIQMTAKEFFEGYLYDRDYVKAPVMGFNTLLRVGNALENVGTVFPDGQFVDLYFPSTSAEAADWRILRLVFEEHEGEMKLSAIIHSEYTE